MSLEKERYLVVGVSKSRVRHYAFLFTECSALKVRSYRREKIKFSLDIFISNIDLVRVARRNSKDITNILSK